MSDAKQSDAPKVERPKNNVQVGSQRSKYLYADLAKHLLHSGEATVVISALGQAISDAVAVVEMLKNQGVADVKNIYTSRGEEETARRRLSDKIEITVVKSADFDAKYAEQQKQREEKKAAKEATKEATKE
jgi:DNA-binding protein Alba